MNRQERISLHKKQERLQVQNGVPSVDEMREGVPELRYVEGTGLIEYSRFNNVLHEKVLEKSNVKEVISSNKWYAVVLENSWVAYNVANNAPQYMIDNNKFVHLRGILKSGSPVSADMFSLPQGFRPAFGEVFAGAASGGFCGISVDADGDVRAYTGGSATYTSIDGITFEGGY